MINDNELDEEQIKILKETKVCPFPFSRIELGHIHKEFVPCCYAWFNDEYRTRFKDDKKSYDYEKTWNSRQAIELRNSIYDGSYKFCNTSRCNKPQMSLYDIKQMDPNYFETPIGNEVINDILNKNPNLSTGPSSISLSGDYKCNLKCPTCRHDYKIQSSPFEQVLINSELKFIEKVKDSLEVLKLSNNGEVFFSKDQRRLLKSLSKEEYPKLKHLFVITNALLFNQKNFDLLSPGSHFIKKIAVSLDAGNEESYALTRGGNWNLLLNNLEWIGDKRRKNEFLWVNYNFVIRKANFRSIPEFIELGRKNHVDRFEFIKYDDWRALYGTQLPLSDRYSEEAVHLPENELYEELIEILRPYKDDPDIALNIDTLNFSL